MLVLILITLLGAIISVSLYSRYRLRVVEEITSKKQTFSDQFTLSDDVVNFDKYLNDNADSISESKLASELVKKAKLFYWGQGVFAGLLVIEFIVYAIL